MEEQLIQVLAGVPYLFLETLDYLLGLPPAQLVLVFWAFFFLEIPRYLFSDIYVLYLYLTRERSSDAHLGAASRGNSAIHCTRGAIRRSIVIAGNIEDDTDE